MMRFFSESRLNSIHYSFILILFYEKQNIFVLKRFLYEVLPYYNVFLEKSMFSIMNTLLPSYILNLAFHL